MFLMGAAGGGKTALAIAAGVLGIEAGLYDHILLTRINVVAGSSVGFLPGDGAGKNKPWIANMLSELHRWIGVENTEKLWKAKKI